MRSKLDQACDLIRRLQARNLSWIDTVRNLTLLVSESRQAVAERDDMAAHPLGYVHGVLARIQQETGPDTALTLMLHGSGGLRLSVKTPKGVALMEFAPEDYNANADRLAADVRRVCERQLVLQREEAR